MSLLPASAVAVAAAGVDPVAGGAPRPNFLVVITDDQRWDALGVVQREQGERGRFPWFRTPNLDRLAAGGVRFHNAFVVNSLCAPSRACYLTGRYSHVNGVANNQTPFPANNVTHASLLRKAGYATGSSASGTTTASATAPASIATPAIRGRGGSTTARCWGTARRRRRRGGWTT